MIFVCIELWFTYPPEDVHLKLKINETQSCLYGIFKCTWARQVFPFIFIASIRCHIVYIPPTNMLYMFAFMYIKLGILRHCNLNIIYVYIIVPSTCLRAFSKVHNPHICFVVLMAMYNFICYVLYVKEE